MLIHCGTIWRQSAGVMGNIMVGLGRRMVRDLEAIRHPCQSTAPGPSVKSHTCTDKSWVVSVFGKETQLQRSACVALKGRWTFSTLTRSSAVVDAPSQNQVTQSPFTPDQQSSLRGPNICHLHVHFDPDCCWWVLVCGMKQVASSSALQRQVNQGGCTDGQACAALPYLWRFESKRLISVLYRDNFLDYEKRDV